MSTTDDTDNKIGQMLTDLGVDPDAPNRDLDPSERTADTDTPSTGDDTDKATEDADRDKGPENSDKPKKSDTSALTDLQRRTAKQFGLDEARLAALGDGAADVLDEIGREWSRKMSQLGRRKVQKSDADPGDAEQASGEDETQDEEIERPPVHKPTKSKVEDADLADLTVEQLLAEDPKYHNDHRALTRALQQRVAALEGQIAAWNNQQTEAETRTFFEEVGQEFPDYAEHPYSPAYARTPNTLARKMQAIVREATAIQAGFAANGEPISWPEALERAWLYRDSDDIRQAEREKLRDQQRQRRQQRTFRPNTRSGVRDGRSRDQQADDAVDAKARQLGIALAE